MLRRLLTCLALLTGLAAIGAPAGTALAETLSGQIGASVMAEAAEDASPCTCSPESDRCTLRPAKKAGQSVKRTIRVYIPTVQFGADRAYE